MPATMAHSSLQAFRRAGVRTPARGSGRIACTRSNTCSHTRQRPIAACAGMTERPSYSTPTDAITPSRGGFQRGLTVSTYPRLPPRHHSIEPFYDFPLNVDTYDRGYVLAPDNNHQKCGLMCTSLSTGPDLTDHKAGHSFTSVQQPIRM
jgi:hypothetical protein